LNGHDYDVVAHHRDGREHLVQYASDDPLEVGAVLRLEGRYWLIESIDSARVMARPARYRLTLRHPDGREEAGAFRRFRPDSPRLGHSLATIEDGQAANWQVVDQRLASDENGEPYLELVAERDFSEVEELSDHELEHAFARREDEELPEGVAATFARAEAAGLSVELVALEPGEEPDWEEAERYIDALILEEIEDDLIEPAAWMSAATPRTVGLRRSRSGSPRTSACSATTSKATMTRSRSGAFAARASSSPSGATTTRPTR
jgi:hypothetical protein